MNSDPRSPWLNLTNEKDQEKKIEKIVIIWWKLKIITAKAHE